MQTERDKLNDEIWRKLKNILYKKVVKECMDDIINKIKETTDNVEIYKIFVENFK